MFTLTRCHLILHMCRNVFLQCFLREQSEAAEPVVPQTVTLVFFCKHLLFSICLGASWSLMTFQRWHRVASWEHQPVLLVLLDAASLVLRTYTESVLSSKLWLDPYLLLTGLWKLSLIRGWFSSWSSGMKTESKKALSSLSFICYTVAKSSLQQRFLFVQPLNTKAADEASTFFASLNSSWALAFLTTSLNAQEMFLGYSFVTCPFSILCKAFSHWSSLFSLLFSEASLLIFLNVFLSIVVDCYCACNMLSLTHQLSWATLPFRSFSQGIPWTCSLNTVKCALLKSQSIICYLLSSLS